MSTEPTPDRPRRATCTVCERPLAMCLCPWVRPVAHATEVLILQHPLEVHHAKNTALLLHFSLARSQRVVGEVFEPATLPTTRFTVLLYPTDPPGVGPQPDNASVIWPAPEHLRLVVLDATCQALAQLEGGAAAVAPLLTAFGGYVDKFQDFLPHSA